MIDKLMIVALVVVIATNLKIFISELKRDFQFNKMNIRLNNILNQLEEEVKEEILEIAKVKEEEKNESSGSGSQEKRRRGRPKKEEVK
jgi:hypothetical protein